MAAGELLLVTLPSLTPDRDCLHWWTTVVCTVLCARTVLCFVDGEAILCGVVVWLSHEIVLRGSGGGVSVTT